MSCFLKLATLLFSCCGRSNRVGPEPLEGTEEAQREKSPVNGAHHRNGSAGKRPSSSKSQHWNTANSQRPSTSKSESQRPSTSKSDSLPGLSAKPVFPALNTGWTTPSHFAAAKIEQVGEQAPLRETKEFVCQEVELERSLLDHEIIHVLSADCSRRLTMEESNGVSRKRKIKHTKCRTQMAAAISTAQTRMNRPKAAVRRRYPIANTTASIDRVQVVGLGCQSSGNLPDVSE